MHDQVSPKGAGVVFQRSGSAAAAPASDRLAMTVKEAAGLLGVSYMTLWRAINENEFPAVKLRGRILVPVKAVDLLFQVAVEAGGLVDAPDWTAAWQAQSTAAGVS